MKWMLDSNICIDLMRGKNPVVDSRFESIDRREMSISTIVFAELATGTEKSKNPKRNHEALFKLADSIRVLPFDREAALAYSRIRTSLERAGTPIGPLDTLIAAHALSLNLPLVTNNTREFSRVEGLLLEDWNLPA